MVWSQRELLKQYVLLAVWFNYKAVGSCTVLIFMYFAL